MPTIYNGELAYSILIPGCAGENTAYPNQIAVNSFGFGATATASHPGVSGSSGGTTSCSEINLDLAFDKAAPLLFRSMTKGTSFATVTLTGYKLTSAGSPAAYLVFKLTSVYVISVQISAAAAMPGLGVALTYDAITINYSSQSANGSLTSTGPVTYTRSTQISS